MLHRLLEWFPPGLTFILTAIMIRATHATANALSSTANFAYIGLEFPNAMAKVFVSISSVGGGGDVAGTVLGVVVRARWKR